MTAGAGAAYSRRAEEYADLFGSMAAVHPSDRQLVETWAETVTGRVIDAGCGPGHWTSFLASRGLAASGVDASEALIAHARRAHRGILFEVGDLDELDVATGSLGGVLAWYSMIHHQPDAIHIPLTEFARVLGADAGLLIGFFEGPTVEVFDHAVLSAYRRPVADLVRELRSTGFDIVETHTRVGASERPRPHGAIVARRKRPPVDGRPACVPDGLR